MDKTYNGPFIAVLLVLLMAASISCGSGTEETRTSLEEAKAQAKEAIDSAEILMQGARPGTDLSDARELLDQARDLYDSAAAVEDYIGPDRSVLALVEEAKSKARQAMEAQKL